MSDTIEIQFARLDEKLKNLEKKQDEHHITILNELKELGDGTATKITDHEGRIKALETWKTARTEQIKEEDKTISRYVKIIVFMAVLIIGLIIWHLTGYHI